MRVSGSSSSDPAFVTNQRKIWQAISMKGFGIGWAVVVATALTGCASGMHSNQTDYNSLPGSGDHMKQGPGLMDGSHYDAQSNSFAVYSDRKDSNAAFSPNRQAPSGETRTVATPVHSAQSASASAPASADKQAEYRQFQEYQQFRKFKQRPANSAERQRFQEWQQYKQWQDSQKHGN